MDIANYRSINEIADDLNQVQEIYNVLKTTLDKYNKSEWSLTLLHMLMKRFNSLSNEMKITKNNMNNEEEEEDDNENYENENENEEDEDEEDEKDDESENNNENEKEKEEEESEEDTELTPLELINKLDYLTVYKSY